MIYWDDLRSSGKEDLSKALEEIRGLGYDVLGIEADVGTSDGCEHFYSRTVNELGTVDILVNNVGGTVGGRDFISATDQDWLDTININLFSSVRLTRLVIPNMKENIWGRIVNIASIWGREYGGAPTYMTAKAAVIAFSKHMAINLAPYNVLVNSVAPGSIKFSGGSWDRFANNLPMGKFGWPEPLGNVVAFLCSNVADLVTGTSINVDGGQSNSLI